MFMIMLFCFLIRFWFFVTDFVRCFCLFIFLFYFIFLFVFYLFCLFVYFLFIQELASHTTNRSHLFKSSHSSLPPSLRLLFTKVTHTRKSTSHVLARPPPNSMPAYPYHFGTLSIRQSHTNTCPYFPLTTTHNKLLDVHSSRTQTSGTFKDSS